MRAVILALLFPLPATAQDAPRLAFPVDCTLGETCMIQQVMDRDPGPGARDFTCGSMSYDGHSGTDIRLPDMVALALNVPVLAAAPGTVLGTRATIPDTGLGGFPEGQDCGNGLVIDHGDGWQTQYCHMAQGSVLVASVDRVEAGQPLGTIGFSGNTEFPHLHFTVRHNGENVDPFDPSNSDSCGADPVNPLWATEIPLAQGGILSVGFAEAIPEYEAVQAGTADAQALPTSTSALILWGFFHSGQAGDVIRLTIADPQGIQFHTQDVTLERTQAQLFRATGRRNRANLPSGTYTGTVTLLRGGVEIDSETTTISIN